MRQFGMNLNEWVDWDLPVPYVALLPVTAARSARRTRECDLSCPTAMS
jgi:hypothetical protein